MTIKRGDESGYINRETMEFVSASEGVSEAAPERIVCAAIWFDDGAEYVHQPKNVVTGFVLCGWRHGSCFGSLLPFGKRGPEYQKQEQGFLTSQNRFVSRKEAYRIAEQESQIVSSPTHHGILFSEDLY